MAPHRARTEPTDRSMPAVSTTSVMPVEMQMFTEICRITFQPLATVKNLSDSRLMARHRMSSAISD